MIQTVIDFNGPCYERKFDHARLNGQIADIYALMRDGKYRTLAEIEAITGHGQASVSAQLRHLRKPRFGSYIIDKRSRGDRINGLWEYKLGERNE